jgi:carbonic anhydrase
MPELSRNAGRLVAAAMLVVGVICVVGFAHRDTVMQSLHLNMPMTGEAAVFAMADSDLDAPKKTNVLAEKIKHAKARAMKLAVGPRTGAPVIPMNHGTAAPIKINASNTTNFTNPEWGYQVGVNSNGPDSWPDKYNTVNKKGFCDGKQQSPIDINEQRDLQLHVSNQLKLNWKMWRPTADQYVDVINTGRTIQIQGKGLEISTTEFEHKNYKLQNIRFYQPSEHTINGQNYPMEMRFVHQAADGSYFELALLMKENMNRVASKLWRKEPCYECNDNYFFNMSLNWMDLPQKPGTEKRLQHGFDLLDMMPDDLNYFAYTGSFSSPPCTEGVQYAVLLPHKEINLTPRQIAAFPFHGNNRPVQPLDGRIVDYLSKEHGQYVSPVYTQTGFYGTAPPNIEGKAYDAELDTRVQITQNNKYMHKVFRDLGRIKKRRYLHYGGPKMKHYTP